MKSFLLIGQSNMAGRGDFGEVPDIKNPKCKMLRNGRWQPMSEPIVFDRSIFITYHSGIGLSASFADEFAKYYGEEIGLIPCADGGTSVRDWQPGGPLYDHAVFQTKLAMRTSEIAGILWHQGESDSLNVEDRDNYRERFMNMLDGMKKEIGLPDDIPVILGELGQYLETYKNGVCKYYKDINAIQKSISEELPCGGYVTTEGLTPKADNLHFNSVSLRELGKRYFAEYKRITENRA